ncbi:MAG: hypothetical protein JO035_16785 [Betaproteobacteria bacterium]|nr:hypothetical protein [Betaproteobacteria bacterium]
MLGRAAVAMWWDAAPRMRAEIEDWHTHEHMPERLGIPGFLRGSRWSAVSGKPSFFVLYETKTLKTTTTGAYLHRLNHPTPWSRKMMPQHLNMVRSLCRVRASAGHGLGRAIATIRFSSRRKLPSLRKLAARKGLAAAHLLESLPPSGIPHTVERGLRSGDRAAERILLVCGYDEKSVTAAARALRLGKTDVYRLAFALTPADLHR